MIVSDIYNDAMRFLGNCNEAEIFGRLTDAVETLANKGQWEPLLGYVDIPITTDVIVGPVPATTVSNVPRIVTLPTEVEMPIRVNVDNTPSYARDRLYEFTLNGPGSNAVLSGWQWEDRGPVPVFAPSQYATAYKTVSLVSDNGKKLKIWGKDADGADIHDELTLNSTTSPVTTGVYAIVTRVIKDVTISPVTLVYTGPFGENTASIILPNETEPQYRQIRLSKTGTTAHILFRRKTFKIVSQDDFIPLHSKMAILMMLKANEAFRNGSSDQMSLAMAYEKQALSFLKEEQDSRNTFAELAAQDDQPILGLNINNRDSIIAADIYDDAAKIFGPSGQTLDRITETVEALANKGQWSGMDGYVDITVDDNVVTLPRYVESPIAVNIGGRPTFMRNRWFEFHLNGPGSDCGGPVGWVWDDRGDVVTLKDVDYDQQLVAIPDLDSDNGKYIRIFGHDADDKWIRSTNPITNALDDGFWVEMNRAKIVPSTDAQKVSRITRIVKDETDGFVRLDGFDDSRNDSVTIGYYYPDETEPNYRRIIVGCGCGWVRIRYRKRTLKIKSLTDPIHLKSKLAVVTMMMSIAALAKGDIQTAEAMEAKAVKYLSEEESSRNPDEVFSFQFDTGVSWASPEQGVI